MRKRWILFSIIFLIFCCFISTCKETDFIDYGRTSDHDINELELAVQVNTPTALKSEPSAYYDIYVSLNSGYRVDEGDSLLLYCDSERYEFSEIKWDMGSIDNGISIYGYNYHTRVESQFERVEVKFVREGVSYTASGEMPSRPVILSPSQNQHVNTSEIIPINWISDPKNTTISIFENSEGSSVSVSSCGDFVTGSEDDGYHEIPANTFTTQKPCSIELNLSRSSIGLVDDKFLRGSFNMFAVRSVILSAN